jgi:TRAP-type C4-dicarboxylate transport system permease small subunit
VHAIFERLASALAIVGGLAVAGIALVTTGSVASRWAFGRPLLGDTEVVEFGMAVVVACFLPLCQWRKGNVVVDFFTARAPAAVRDALERAGALLVAAMLGLLAWRTAAGAIDQHRDGAVTMLLQWPQWIAYLLMAVPTALAAAMALYTAPTGRSGARDAGTPALPGPAGAPGAGPAAAPPAVGRSGWRPGS